MFSVKRTFACLILTIALASGATGADRKISAASGTEQVAPVSRAMEYGLANGAGKFSLHGATVENVDDGRAIKITGKNWAEYEPATKLATRGGSISFWIKPLWTETDQSSRTILSLPWDDGRKGYLALSQGWWEPAGAGRLYFILNNRDYLHSSVPYRLVPGFWTHIAVTWQNGDKGSCRIYIDGEKVAQTDKPFLSNYRAAGPLIIGSDRGTAEKKGRGIEALVSGLTVAAGPLSGDEIWTRFQSDRKHSAAAEQKKWKWLHEGMKLPVHNRKNDAGTLIETRAIFDEDVLWATSRQATDTILSRIKRAGFNVYVPCVWHGKSAYFPSLVAGPDSRIKRRIDAGDDPLAYLIEKAHALGIEVHPWFTVVKRSTDGYPDYYSSGTPEAAFDVHNGEFRNFVKALMLDVVRRYDVDGVNLDYIRAMGVCTSASCRADYEKETGCEFWPDYALREVSGPARDRLQNWQDQAVSDIVSGFSQASKALKPGLIVSVDGHPQPKDAIRPLQGKDELLWANNGWIDVIFAMDYSERVDFETIDQVRRGLLDPNKLIVLFGNYDKRDTTVVGRPGKLVDNYAAYARRKWVGSGVAFYLYGQLSDDQVETLARGTFLNKALPAWRHTEGVQTGLW